MFVNLAYQRDEFWGKKAPLKYMKNFKNVSANFFFQNISISDKYGYLDE